MIWVFAGSLMMIVVSSVVWDMFRAEKTSNTLVILAATFSVLLCVLAGVVAVAYGMRQTGTL